MTKIRSGTLADARSIAGIHVASWRETYAGIVPDDYLSTLSIDRREEMWRKIVEQGAAGIFVASSDDGELLGFGSCGKQRSPELPYVGEFQAIYVLRSAQRRGLGRALMAAMSQHLMENKMSSAALWVVRENLAACRFYEALGGAIVAEKADKREDFTLWEVAYAWQSLDGHFGRPY